MRRCMRREEGGEEGRAKDEGDDTFVVKRCNT